MRDNMWDMIRGGASGHGPQKGELRHADARRRGAHSHHKTERGVVLLMVLILSAVALAVMTALIYMTTIGTQTSGVQKRYRTALEAGLAGADVFTQIITMRGDTSLFPDLGPVDEVPAACTGTSLISSLTYTGIRTKILTAATGTTGAANWSNSCDQKLLIDRTDATTYDLSFSLGTSPNPVYNVYAKIVDAVEGNTGSGSNSGNNLLGTQGVVANGSGEVAVRRIPYLYTIEIDAQNANQGSTERAKLQVLYQN